ncbi:MAG: BamA/TamA family outer membrane protein [Bacteriovorax sp.]|nr:BamA/TamA family outer membrane protein [Bacteriovorax sp.]
MIRLLLALFILLSLSFVVQAELVPSKNVKLKGIEWVTTLEMKTRFKSYFEELSGKPWDVLKFKIKVDQIIKELFNSGYFSSSVKTELMGTESDVIAKISIQALERTNFQFKGNKIFSYQELRKRLIDKIRNDFGKTDRGALGNFINEIYEGAGIYNTSVKSYQNEGHDLDSVAVKNYYFEIEEGEKLKVSNVFYRGNLAIRGEDLDALFKKSATTLVLAGYYDKTFFENYTDIIKKEYLSKGFVFAEVSKPRVVTNDDDETLSIEFGIAEKQQVMLKAVTLKRIDPGLQAIVKKILTNKEGGPLNVVELEADLKKVITYFQEEGYYFASIANLNAESLLVYDKTYSFVELQPDIILDRQICYNETIVNGNIKTLPEVIFREIDISKGELITPTKLETARQKLSSLGLFSSLRISPYMIYEGDEKSCAKTNLVIQVKEKDFGLFEVAPGYRTDLGAKLSTGVTYNNFMGMNRSASLKVQANQRFNLDGFDLKRRQEDKKLFEYLGKVSYIEPYLFHSFIKTQVELEMASSFQRKRFSGFDADIFRISPQLSKNVTKNFSTSVKYQLERINQFDATVPQNNDNFTIGGITPSVTYDKRNDPINPRKGYYLNLSSEWANNYFGSMKNDDLEVNYIKLISRNKFYYPLGNFTLAFSLAMGYEKNFALDILKDSSGNVLLNSNNIPRTHGYIPSIKVFRLDGYDEIRGYAEDEINRLKTGQPIGDVVVQREAYFTAFKFEPRYNITDAILFGVFFDAGRVFVDEFKPFDLRTSVGAGIKFLTPVGSLDFDYGVKLQRRTYPDNSRDSVGRFLLSIGFF